MITVEYPLTLPSLANARFCWQSKAALVKRQRNTTWFALHGNYLAHQIESACKIPIDDDRKLVVTMTRCAPRAIRDKHDNLRSCLKHVVDEIAAYFHVDDSDARIEWRYAQEKAATSSVRLCFVVEKKSPTERGESLMVSHSIKKRSDARLGSRRPRPRAVSSTIRNREAK